MNPINAAKNVFLCIKDMEIPPKRDPEGISIEHAAWMLNGIIHGYIQHEKAHRWLGYAQGIFVTHGLVTLENMKQANKGAADHDEQDRAAKGQSDGR